VAAFPDMHRELYRFFVDGDTVIVELALQGTQKGPLEIAPGNHTADGQTDGRAVLRRVSLEKRQDSILQLLSVRHGDFGAIGRSANFEMSVRESRREDFQPWQTIELFSSLE
jgi:hypothetical protein